MTARYSRLVARRHFVAAMTKPQSEFAEMRITRDFFLAGFRPHSTVRRAARDDGGRAAPDDLQALVRWAIQYHLPAD